LAEEIEELLRASVEARCEGLMVKALNAPYTPGRSLLWLKVRPTRTTKGE